MTVRTTSLSRGRGVLRNSSSAPVSVRVGVGGGCLLLAAYAAHALFTVGGHGLDGLFQKWVNDATVVLAALACLWRAVTIRAQRLAWSLLSVGMGSWVAGNIYYSLFLIDRNPLPIPSVADGLWLGLYPPVCVALVLLLRPRAPSFHVAAWLDGLIVALGAAALSVATVLAQVIHVTRGQTGAAALTNLAYPVADLILLGLVVAAFAASAWRPARGWVCLGVGLLAFLITDSLFLIQTAQGRYRVGTIVDAGWLLAALLLAVAAWQPLADWATVRVTSRRVLLMPIAFGSVSLGLLFWDHFERLNTLAVALAFSSLLMVAPRFVLVFAERARTFRAERRARDRAEAAEQQLRSSERAYRLLFEQNPNPMWVFDREALVFLAVNDAAIAHYGYSREEFVGMSIFEIRPPEEWPLLEAHLADPAVEANQREHWRHRTKDGRLIDVLISASDIDFEGRPGRVTLATDITAKLRAEAAMLESEQRYRDLFENAAEPIATADLDGVITDVNHAFARALGYSHLELVGTRLDDYVTSESSEAAVLARRRKLDHEVEVTTYEQVFLTKDGQHVTLEVSTRTIEEHGAPVGIQGLCRDVTERKRAEAELKRLVEVNHQQARHDALTGLPNRVFFREQIEEEITTSGGPLAVFVMDLDRFREINDTLGHDCGDRLVGEVADRLHHVVRGGDTIARLGGDEFGILLRQLSDPDQSTEEVANRITQVLAEPVPLHGFSINVEASVGIACYPRDGSDADTLLQHADVAMYLAKTAGETHTRYSPERDVHNADQLFLVGELRRALDERELILHFQPEVELRGAGRRVVCLEALVRWQHPKHGLIPPGDFIPFAEQTGLITPVTLYVLAEALRQSNLLDVDVSVNLSARTLHDTTLPDVVANLLREAGVTPNALTLEVTESAIVRDPARAKLILNQLSTLGVKLAIDDFGTGYSSLGLLNQLSIDQLKIDRSFVTNLTTNPDDAAIVRSLINLGHDLNLEVVAEGVESEAVLTWLRRHRCDRAQGHHLSQPVSADAIAEALRDPREPRPKRQAA